LVGATAMLFALALCQAAGRCPYQDDDGSCIKEKDVSCITEEIEQFFLEEPDAEEKAWGVLHDFYHYLLTWMKENNVSKAELARRFGKSREYVDKMLRQTPNISIKEIVEITHRLGLVIKIIIENHQNPEPAGNPALRDFRI
jgi:DNA-binding phage protein